VKAALEGIPRYAAHVAANDPEAVIRGLGQYGIEGLWRFVREAM
jgi:hypothetical protein